MKRFLSNLALFCALAGFGGLRLSAATVQFWAFSSHPCTVRDVSQVERAFDRLSAGSGGYYYVYGDDYGLTDMIVSDAPGYESITAEDVSGCRFLGWYTKKAGWGDVQPTVSSATDRLVSTKTLSLADIEKAGLYGGRPTVVAKYIPIYVIATAVSPTGAGGVSGGGTYDEGETVTLRATAAVGYSPKGWKKGDSTLGTFATYSFRVDADSAGVYTALFGGNAYKVDLRTCGGSGGQTTVWAQYGSPMPPLSSLPSRRGWNFTGYYSSPTRNATQYYDSNGTPVRDWDRTQNGSLWEKWTPQMAPLDFLITKGVKAICYRVGGASWTTNTSNTTIKRQVGIPVEAYGIPAVGHEIVDNPVGNPWKKEIPESGLTFEPAAARIVVTFADPSGTYTNEQSMVDENGAATAPKWTRAGYTLSWDTDFSAVTEVVTINAVWTPLTFFVEFDGNGATSGEMEMQSFLRSVPEALLTNAYARTGYQFGEWADGRAGVTNRYVDGATVQDLAETGETNTLRAVWTPLTFFVGFDGNGATSGEMEMQDLLSDTPKALSSNAYARTGYQFVEWADGRTGVTNHYADGAIVMNLAETGETNTLRAVWKANTYTVRFDANGGAGSMADVTATYDAALTLPTNAFMHGIRTFLHWTTTVGGVETTLANGASVSNLTAAVDGAVVLRAVWGEEYRVGFDGNGATSGEMEVQGFVRDVPQALASNAYVRMGYRFDVWEAERAGVTNRYADGAIVTNLAEAGETNTLRAVWTPLIFFAGFDGNGATSGEMEIQEFLSGIPEALATNTYARTGYQFVEWADGRTGVTNHYADGATVTNLAVAGETNVLRAVWKANAYTLRFDANGGKGTMPDVTATYDAALELPTNAFTRGIRTFLHWTTTVDGVETTFANCASVSNLTAAVGGTVVLHAVWREDYLVGFDGNGATSGEMGQQSFIRDVSQALTSNAYARIGYQFDKWDDERASAQYPDGKVVQNLAEAGETNTLHAVWKPNEYTVRFDANGGEGTMLDVTATYDAAFELPANAFTCGIRTFVHWTTTVDVVAADGTIESVATNFTDGATVSNLTVAAGGTNVLYAVWGGEYKVGFDGNGATSGGMEMQPFVRGEAQPLAPNAYARIGYQFDVWADGRTGETNRYADGATVSDLAEAGTTNVLRAVWNPNAYTVRFDANGGAGTMPDVTATYDTALELPANAFTHGIRTFLHWTTTVDVVAGGMVTPGATNFTDGATVSNLTVAPGATNVLYAVWREDYLVGFDGNGATSGEMGQQSFIRDVSQALTSNAYARIGYQFGGWDDECVGVTNHYADGATVTNLAEAGETKNLRAAWVANKYTVRFNPNGGIGEITNQVFTYGSPEALRSNTFARADYSFGGWATATNGVRTYGDCEVVSNLTAEVIGVVDLYATWLLTNQYSIAADCATSEGGHMALELTVTDKSRCLVVSNATDAVEGGNDQYVKLFLPSGTGNADLSCVAPCAGTLTFHYKIYRTSGEEDNYFIVRKGSSEVYKNYGPVSDWTSYDVPLETGNTLLLGFTSTYNEGAYVLVDKITFTAAGSE